MTIIITPVGTSLFNNGSESNNRIAQTFQHIKDKRVSDWDRFSAYIDRLGSASEEFINENGESASAELQSSAKIQTQLGVDITIRLIATDTITSRLAAEILKANAGTILGSKVSVEFDSSQDVIRGLQAENSAEFSKYGRTNLFRRLHSIRDNLETNQTLAINITAGYAATVALLTYYAQLNGLRIYYNFKDSTVSIEIPQMR